jgi:flagellar hook-length control protein FliK
MGDQLKALSADRIATSGPTSPAPTSVAAAELAPPPTQPGVSADAAFVPNASLAYNQLLAPAQKSIGKPSAPTGLGAVPAGSITPLSAAATNLAAALPPPVDSATTQGLIGPTATSVETAAASLIAQSNAKQFRDVIKGEPPVNSTSAAASAAQATPDTTPANHPGLPAVLNLNVAPGSHEIPQALASQVSWMIDRDMNGAKMQVNPPHLGPIEVQVSLNGDRAQVWFGTHSDAAREALQSSFPQLREMLGAQGFSNVSVDVSQHSFQQSASFQQSYNGQRRESESGQTSTPSTAVSVVASTTSRIAGGVDAYA